MSGDRGVSVESGVAVRVLAISGSLRAASYNTGLLRAAARLAPPGMEVRIWNRLREIPPYDADADAAPEAVADLRAAITAADAILIATPEYNHSVPGVLKNAIDWASRPARRSPLLGKPTAIVGASAGMSGTMRAQIALREVLFSTGSPVLPGPEVYVGAARDKFDEGATLTDRATLDYLENTMAAFDRWARRLIAAAD